VASPDQHPTFKTIWTAGLLTIMGGGIVLSGKSTIHGPWPHYVEIGWSLLALGALVLVITYQFRRR